VVARAWWPRIAVALIATLLVAWFLVLARDQHVGSAAVDRIIANPDMPRDRWNEVMDDLANADLFDPSTDWDLLRANYLLLHQPAKARRVGEAIVRREPDNLGGWVVILQTTRGHDPARARQAAREIRRLNPLP
jgi:hypothetical protein